MTPFKPYNPYTCKKFIKKDNMVNKDYLRNLRYARRRLSLLSCWSLLDRDLLNSDFERTFIFLTKLNISFQGKHFMDILFRVDFDNKNRLH